MAHNKQRECRIQHFNHGYLHSVQRALDRTSYRGVWNALIQPAKVEVKVQDTCYSTSQSEAHLRSAEVSHALSGIS